MTDHTTTTTRFDVGEIVRQTRVSVPPHATSGALHEALSVLGARLLVSVVRDLPSNYLLATPQPSTGVSNGEYYIHTREAASSKNGVADGTHTKSSERYWLI